MTTTRKGHQNHSLVVRGDLDFYVALLDGYDQFRKDDLSPFTDSEARFRQASRRGFITFVGTDEDGRRRYETTALLADLVADAREAAEDTICPCSCLQDGVHNREDGYHCPNPDCDEGPWQRGELDV